MIVDKFINKIDLTTFAFFFAFGISSVSWATPYYVAKNGSDSNFGTEVAPWSTIQKAANMMVAGDIVYIRGGTYYENITPVNSGTETNYITYSNYGSETVVIDAQDSGECIYINNKKYLGFKNIQCKNAQRGTNGDAAILVEAGSNHILFDGVKSSDSRFGIRLNGTKSETGTAITDVIIKNSELHDNSMYGLFIYRKCNNITVGPNNKIYNNGILQDEGWLAHTFGIEVGAAYGSSTTSPDPESTWPADIEIYQNEIYQNEEQGIRPGFCKRIWIHDNYIHNNGATGIQVEHHVENIVIERNILDHNAGWHNYETGLWFNHTINGIARNNIVRENTIGIMTQYCDNIIIRHNLIVENDRGVADVNWGSYDNLPPEFNGSTTGLQIHSDTDYAYIINNTFHKNSHPDSASGSFRIKHPSSSFIMFKNNIVSETQTDSDSEPDDMVIGYDNNFRSDYNCVYNTKTLSVEWLGNDMSWSSYKNASGDDANSITTNPMFVNPTTYGGDFTLQPGSKCIDVATFLTKVTSGTGSGTVFTVDDAHYFCNGFNTGASGDTIKVGDNPNVTIKDINYTTNSITVDKAISWAKGDSVSFPYSGSAPDMGAFEYGASGNDMPPDPPDGFRIVK